MANRQGRIKSVIAKDIAEIVQRELHNPHIGLVSVNEVEVSDDYAKARVFVSFIGAKYPHQNFDELKKTTGYVRSALAKMVDLFQVPEIVFVYDEAFEKSHALDEALRREAEAIKKTKTGK
jgi:ribosome-binding factor A